VSTRKRARRPVPEREGRAVNRACDRRAVTITVTVEDAAEAALLLEWADAIYEAMPGRQSDVTVYLRSSGVHGVVQRVFGALLAAVADVVDPDGAAQLELAEAGA
jgi:hypothetical protein